MCWTNGSSLTNDVSLIPAVAGMLKQGLRMELDGESRAHVSGPMNALVREQDLCGGGGGLDLKCPSQAPVLNF